MHGGIESTGGSVVGPDVELFLSVCLSGRLFECLSLEVAGLDCQSGCLFLKVPIQILKRNNARGNGQGDNFFNCFRHK